MYLLLFHLAFYIFFINLCIIVNIDLIIVMNDKLICMVDIFYLINLILDNSL